MFLIYHVTSRDNLFKGLCFMCVILVIISHHLAKFCGLRPCSSRDITGLIFHVTLQDHMAIELCDFMKGSSSLHISTMSSLVVAGIAMVDV